MLAYNITLKLKSYTQQIDIDFKSAIRQLSNVKTIINDINIAIKFETIPKVNDNLQKLFTHMKLKFPTKI